MEGDTFLLAILKTLTSTFHLIFSDFMFILWLGSIVGEQACDKFQPLFLSESRLSGQNMSL